MRTLLLLILSITLCLGESCWWSEKAVSSKKIEMEETQYEIYPSFRGKNYASKTYTVTYFCIDGKMFVGTGFTDGLTGGVTTSITQVLRNSAVGAGMFVTTCKCEENK